MSKSHSFILPWPPTINHAYHLRGRGGGLALTAASRAFRKEVGVLMHKYVPKRGPLYPLSVRLFLEIYLHAPDRRIYDLDNRLKAVQDALQHAGMYEADSQIDKLSVTRGEPGAWNSRKGYALIIIGPKQ